MVGKIILNGPSQVHRDKSVEESKAIGIKLGTKNVKCCSAADKKVDRASQHSRYRC
jgi:hypothetical protein